MYEENPSLEMSAKVFGELIRSIDYTKLVVSADPVVDWNMGELARMASTFSNNSDYLIAFGEYEAGKLGTEQNNAFEIKFNEVDVQSALVTAADTVAVLANSTNEIIEKEQHEGVWAHDTVAVLANSTNEIIEKEQHEGVWAQIENMYRISTSAFQQELEQLAQQDEF
eukprot:CAMPEP_0202979886 /NCGR_PEP_ID=MMETSP1396-20130829/85918_1 /ASSEMBLY_ACC=CAM_ASM_000872 /TAXON_ID= /ORGANISM="Pseudokeronopsis sp., Strain Brazil" /LENGTH=167 /DNA_ID=CAMNT_0049719527 /DNA_START=860 /DNA_END=1363 /DNA_ORIENTATION=-